MEQKSLAELKSEIQFEAKYGVDFMLSAGILWFFIFLIWNLEYSSYNKSIFTFMVGGVLLPMAFGFSKILKTNWKVKGNPLQPLGLWLNIAQLIYFPFLIFILIKDSDYFIMTYAIITGAHLFPYAWFYDEMGYLVAAILISVGSLLIALNVGPAEMWSVPLFASTVFLLFVGWILIRLRKKKKDVLQKQG